MTSYGADIINVEIKMTKEQNMVLLMILITTLAMIDNMEQTKSVSMFRRKIRKRLNEYYRRNQEEYSEYAKKANDVWMETVEELEGEHIKITVSDIVLAIHTVIADEPLTRKFYTEKGIDKFLNSMKSNTDITDEQYAETEKNVNRIVDVFISKLGINRENKLKTRFHIIKENLILEGKYNG